MLEEKILIGGIIFLALFVVGAIVFFQGVAIGYEMCMQDDVRLQKTGDLE